MLLPTVQPDQGWAWVILAGVFLSNAICSLYALSGVYNVIFLEVFDQSSTATAWLVGIHSALVSLMGPVSSMITNFYGARLTLLLAGLVSSTGFFVTYFVNNFFLVFICYGVLAGAGIGLAYTCLATLPSLYFVKYRGISHAISLIGMSVGNMAFPPFISITTNVYGWRGSMLLMSAICTHFCVSALTIWPVEQEELVEKEDTLPTDHIRRMSSIGVLIGLDSTRQSKSSLGGASEKSSRSNSLNVYSGKSKTGMGKDAPSASMTSLGPESLNRSTLQITSIHRRKSVTSIVEEQEEGDDDVFSKDKGVVNPTFVDNECNNKEERSSNGKDIEKNHGIKESNTMVKRKIADYKLFDVDIFKDVRFCLYCLFITLTNVAIALYQAFLPLTAISHGTHPLHAVNLLTWGSIASILARVIVGLIMTYTDAHEFLLNLLFCILSSASLFVVPYVCQWYIGQLVISVIFGAIGICIYITMPATCITILGLEKISSAVGVVSFVMGIAYLIGPPLGGFLYDMTKHYEYNFYTAGASYLMAGLLMLVMYVTHKVSSKKS